METKNTLGYSLEHFKKYKRYAWKVLLGFSILYCFLYAGRLNLPAAMPTMMIEEGWSKAQLGVLSSVMFWTYGMGHLFNGRLGEIFGLNRFIVAGCILSASANILIGLQSSLIVIIILWGFNGYFQSMAWSPGIALLAKWWPGDKRGFATGFANAFSGAGQAIAAALVLFAFAVAPSMGWRAAFIFPVLIVAVVAIIYKLIIKESPSDIGLKEYVEDNPEKAANEEELKKIMAVKGKWYPYAYLLKQWRFIVWLFIIAGSSISRYGLLTWIPTYFSEVFGVDLKEGIMGILLLPLGMAAGALIVPWLTDLFCPNNRLPAVFVSAIVAAVTVFIFRSIEPGAVASVLLFVAGFAIYGINSIVWAYASDIGGRVFSGTATGILDASAYLGASVQAIFFGFVLDSMGWNVLFTAVIGVCVAVAVLSVIAGWGLDKKTQR